MKNLKIDNIHQKVLAAVSSDNALDMSTWHQCETTHCRAGWVTTLAGNDGKRLEELTSCAFAAKIIYRNSSDINVSFNRFYDTNEAAMEDIKRCAELEKSNIEKDDKK